LSIRQEVQNLQLKELNEEKNEFLGIAAHDLKNPLSGIQNIAEVLLMDDHFPLDSRREMLMHVVKSSERMFELIKNLLDVNAIERGGFHPQIQPTNIRQIAALTTDQYASRAAQKDITISFDAETQAFALADAGALEQIIDNLISNAVKYSPAGKNIVVRLKSEERNVKQEQPDTSSLSPQSVALGSSSFLRFEVQDEGPGLSEADKIKLFGKFARLSAQPTGGEHSTGLGLSIVKKMVEAMNGKVWCESELGKGATFIVELPQAA
jgi:signal transduction histidine kinase